MSTVRLHWRQLCLLGMLLAIIPGHAVASPSPLPANLYPARTSITSTMDLSNVEMDCTWGFVCPEGGPRPGTPLFHFRTQDAMHRTMGWAQFGDTLSRKYPMLFALYASRYGAGSDNGMPWNVRAFADFRTALIVASYTDIDPVPRLFPAGQIGVSSEQVLRSKDGDILAMACWTGSIEVEGMVIYPHRSNAAATIALRSLTNQIRLAVKSLSTSEGAA